MEPMTTCLWFEDQAEEAANFYASVFPDGEVTDVLRHVGAGPGEQGSVIAATVRMNGQDLLMLNGRPAEQAGFGMAVSLVVNCENQDEIDHFWNSLVVGGTPVQCGWLNDKYGVAWQVVPAVMMSKYLTDPDPEKVNRVMTAMMQMVKLDIDTLTKAYEQ